MIDTAEIAESFARRLEANTADAELRKLTVCNLSTLSNEEARLLAGFIRAALDTGAALAGWELVPDGQTPLDARLEHPLLAVINEGVKSRDTGSSSPYHGHSLEHCLHAVGWVQRDLRLALDAANKRLSALQPPASAVDYQEARAVISNDSCVSSTIDNAAYASAGTVESDDPEWLARAAVSIASMVAGWGRGPAPGDGPPADLIARRLARFAPPAHPDDFERGAEAMRELAAQEVEGWSEHPISVVIAGAVRALSLPEKEG